MTTNPTWARPDTDLTGSTALVVGGTGSVGEAVAQALLDRGATVVATGREVQRLHELSRRLEHDRIHAEVLDALDPDLDERARELASTYGRFDGVVVSVASWGDQGRKPALALTDEEWESLIAANLTSVFRLYRAFVPLLSARGALMQLNGMSAELPFPGNAGRALAGAATKSLTLTLAEERGSYGPRIYQLILGVIRTRVRLEQGLDDPRWIPAYDVGVHVAELIAGTSPLDTALQRFVDASGPRAG